MKDLRTAIRLALGTSLSSREIGSQLGYAYNTISRYRRVAAEKNLDLDGLLPLSDADLKAKFYKCPARHGDKRLPDWAHVHRQLQRTGVTRTLLWMEYKEEDPSTAYALSQFNQLYTDWAGKQALSMRQQHNPGERGWTDFSGTRMYWIDPASGERQEAEIFIASVGVSGYLFAWAVPSQKQEHWIHAHCEWYEFLGGVPKITVPDNLKSAVLKPGKEPILNPAYLEMAEHYDTVVLPARPGRPKDKAVVEGAVLIFKRWGIARLRNRVFHSLAELNAGIAECIDIINRREMRRFQQSRIERFEQLDKPELKPLPTRYDYGEWIGPIRVPPDYHIAVKGHFYSVPYRFVQQYVHARCTSTTVEVICDRSRVASHAKSELIGGKTTDRAHMPEQHQLWADHTPERYLLWAKGVGTQALTVIEKLLSEAKHPAGALNACATLQKLSRTHGAARFELACGKALTIQSPTPKSIRSILQNHLEDQKNARNSQRSLPLHSNVRGPAYYQNEEPAHVE